MTDRELLQMALDALENAHANEPIWKTPIKEAIKALRSRLANEFNPDWDQIEALQESLREHMAEIQRLRAALAQPEPVIKARKEGDLIVVDLPQVPTGGGGVSKEQEPTAYLCENAVGHKYFRWKKPSSEYRPIALYTAHASPQRIWQGLTDEEIGAMEKEYLFGGKEFDDEIGYWAVYRAIEAKLKEKNINLDTHFGVEK